MSPNRTDNTKDSLVTDPATILALKSLSFGVRGVKKGGFRIQKRAPLLLC
jgi:hypothetical protein